MSLSVKGIDGEMSVGEMSVDEVSVEDRSQCHDVDMINEMMDVLKL